MGGSFWASELSGAFWSFPRASHIFASFGVFTRRNAPKPVYGTCFRGIRTKFFGGGG